ncbi:MAG TPA: hypothetical protein VFV95_19195 [Vicinamibacterales bacterium]|nr:hypothetical protein [Vicinamibacterales bacterium]
MRRISFLATAIATALLVAGLSAQKADLSGKWTLVPDPNAAPPGGGGGGGGGGRGGGRGGGGGGFCGQECTITQDATTLTVTRTTQAGEQKAVYKLDGSESKNPGRGGAEVVSKAMWEGNKVSISTQQPGRDGGPGVTVNMKVGVTGGQMEVETDAGRGPQKQTYKKG